MKIWDIWLESKPLSLWSSLYCVEISDDENVRNLISEPDSAMIYLSYHLSYDEEWLKELASTKYDLVRENIFKVDNCESLGKVIGYVGNNICHYIVLMWDSEGNLGTINCGYKS